MIPHTTRAKIKEALWARADDANWMTLASSDKARWYENWTQDSSIGGRLGHFMDPRQVRVYIKDTLLKDYGQARLADPKRSFRVLGLDTEPPDCRVYVKPHGRLLPDGRVISWGRAHDWKFVLMAVHERAYRAAGGVPFGAVLLFSTGRYHEQPIREVVEDAARKLRISRLVWLE